MTSGQFFEFWRHDTDTPYDTWEATATTIRRYVTIETSFDEEYGETRLTLTVNRERLSKPERQFNHSMAAFRMFADELPTVATGRPAGADDEYWVPAGRDLAMEQYLLDTIVRRAGG
jgi:hypothetical protein